jgi:hypothetical protein
LCYFLYNIVQVTKDNKLAISGMKTCGISPLNPNWVNDNMSKFLASEPHRTTGNNWTMGEIVRDMPDVNTMTDASHILVARKLMAAVASQPNALAAICEELNIKMESFESMLNSVLIGKYINNPISSVMPHPWWRKLLIKMGEIDADHTQREREGEEWTEGTILGKRPAWFESKAAGMVLNSTQRISDLREWKQTQVDAALAVEAAKQEKYAKQKVIGTCMKEVGGYLVDAFNLTEEFIKASTCHQFVTNNRLKKRDDYRAFALQLVPPRAPGLDFLIGDLMTYLTQLIESNRAMEVGCSDRLIWK